MRFEIDRTTIILVIFILVIAAIFGINQFVQLQPPFEIIVVVDPLAEDWIRDAATQYNADNVIINNTTRVQVNVQVVDDLDVWRGSPGWNSQSHPDAWIPSSSLSLDYAPSSLPFETIDDTLAYTPLVWGGFQNRVDVVTGNGTQAFDWTAVQAVSAGSSWSDGGFVNMAINWPTGSMAGVAVLSGSVSAYQQNVNIDRSILSDPDFVTWFQPLEDSMLNSQRLSGNPAQAMASRGTSAADFALLPESQWLEQLDSLTENASVSFSYSDYQFPLDFPIALWADSQTTDTHRTAVQSFASYLTSEGQSIATDNGFRPANTVLDSSASLFIAGEAYGILLEPPQGQMITNLDRGTADALILLLN